MPLTKKETKVHALGLPWSALMKTLRSARDTHIKLVDSEDVAESIKKSWRKSHEKDYENDLKLMLKLAKKRAKKQANA
jgi:hypothetical protein